MRRRSEKNNNLGRSQEWAKVAKIFESNEGLEVMKNSRALNSIERHRLLGAGKTRLISVRIPEDDLDALKAIAEAHDRKYQQLMVHAIESFLNEYYKHTKIQKKA